MSDRAAFADEVRRDEEAAERKAIEAENELGTEEMSIAEQVAHLERLKDANRDHIGQLTKVSQRLTADRDQWKARAEKAEERIADLERELASAKDTHENLRYGLRESIKQGRAMNKHIERLEQSQPSSLEAVLVELSGDRIPARISLDDDSFHVMVGWPDNGVRRTQLVSSLNHAVEVLEQFAVDLYPDSTFARRRREGEKPAQPTPSLDPPADVDQACQDAAMAMLRESIEPPSSQPSPDIVGEMLERHKGEWRVIKGGIVRSASRTGPDVCYGGKDADALAEMGNRYRRLVEAVNHPDVLYCINRREASPEWNKVYDALRPLVKEAP